MCENSNFKQQQQQNNIKHNEIKKKRGAKTKT